MPIRAALGAALAAELVEVLAGVAHMKASELGQLLGRERVVRGEQLGSVLPRLRPRAKLADCSAVPGLCIFASDVAPTVDAPGWKLAPRDRIPDGTLASACQRCHFGSGEGKVLLLTL